MKLHFISALILACFLLPHDVPVQAEERQPKSPGKDAQEEERQPKSPEAKAPVTEKGEVVSYVEKKEITANPPAEFNAVVRNAVKLRESRQQPEIARDYQCRLIEHPKGSGAYPDDSSLLERFVQPDSIFADRMDVKAPPPGHEGYGKGLKSSDVYKNGVGNAAKRQEK